MGRTTKRVKPVFAENATRLTKARGWNWHELASRARMSHSTVRDILAGISPGLEENRKAIAEALGYTMADLYIEPARDSKRPPDFVSTIDFLNRFSGLSPERKSLVLMFVYDDPSYLAADPALARSVSGLLKVPKLKR